MSRDHRVPLTQGQEHDEQDDPSSRARHVGLSFGHGGATGGEPKSVPYSDERVREEIKDRLMAHPDVDASDIDVRVANGVVTLAGTVEDRHERRIVQYIVEDAVGVDDVNDQLRVRHGFWTNFAGEQRPAGTPADEEGEGGQTP